MKVVAVRIIGRRESRRAANTVTAAKQKPLNRTRILPAATAEALLKR
jgi:hypothetical protein